MNNISEPFNSAGEQLDARGWLCPQPVIAVRRWLQQAAVGQRLHLVITDPHGTVDIAALCARTSHHLVCCEQVDEPQPTEWHILIESALQAPE